MITTALFVTYLYENQFKQDVATDSAKNVLMKRLEGMLLSLGFMLFSIVEISVQTWPCRHILIDVLVRRITNFAQIRLR